MEIDDDRKKQICINYLTMLEWTFKYYISDCKNWRIKYNYNYPPLFKDLLKYIPYFDSNFLTNEENSPVSEIIQLSYVLPRRSLDLLPKSISNKILDNFNENYKLDYEFEWAFCRYFWESHVKDLSLDISKLESILQK